MSQISFASTSTVGNLSVCGSVVDGGLDDQWAEVTGLFKGSNEGVSVVVDVKEIDGQKFMGSLTHKEMLNSVYTKALSLRPENFYSFVLGYRGHPTTKYHLKEKININKDSQGKHAFSFEKAEKIGSRQLFTP